VRSREDETEGLELIRRGLAALADAEGLQAKAIGERLVGLRRVLDEAEMVFAEQFGRFVAMDGPRTQGAANPKQWLAERCRMRSGPAAAMTATAGLLGEVKATEAAFKAGDIGFADVASVAQCVDAAVDAARGTDLTAEQIIERAEPILLTAASSGAHPEELVRLGRAIRYQIDPDGSSKKQRSHARRAFFELGQTMDGAGVGRLQCDDGDYADIEAAVNHFTAPPDPDADEPQHPGHRRLKGLVEVCRTALRHAGKTSGGRPAQVTLVVPVTTITDPQAPPPGRTEWNTVLTAGTVLAKMSEGCEVTPVYTTPEGFPLGAGDPMVVPPLGKPRDLGRDERFFSAHQRLLYSVLYQTCAAVGCDRPLPWTDIDHIREWRDLGPTDLANGRPLCRFHHVRKPSGRPRKTGNDPPTQAA
jgi:Domain of unknown function (DUF222)